MDEFAPYHALGCAAHPLSREHHVFREGCGRYGLRLPLLPVTLPLRSYLYIGSLPVLPFYPFWRILDDPVSVRVQGAVFFLVFVFLAARLVEVPWPRAALAAFVLPILPGSFLVDTGPVGCRSFSCSPPSCSCAGRRGRPRRGKPRPRASSASSVSGSSRRLPGSSPRWRFSRPSQAIRTQAPPRSSFLNALAFVLALLAPSAVLLFSRTTEGTPYYEVLSVGRFSLEPQSLGTVATSLFAYLWNGSSLAPRSITFPPSPLDLLPLGLAVVVIAAALWFPRRRDMLLWMGAAFLTFGITVLSGRALAAHHLAYSLASSTSPS